MKEIKPDPQQPYFSPPPSIPAGMLQAIPHSRHLHHRGADVIVHLTEYFYAHAPSQWAMAVELVENTDIVRQVEADPRTFRNFDTAADAGSEWGTALANAFADAR